MKPVLILCAAIVVAIIVCGCTTPAPAPVTPTPEPQFTPAGTVPPTASSKTSCSATPGPVQTVPSYESVSVTVDRNNVSTDPTITITYNGGKGLGMTTQMAATVIRSDCVVENGVRDHPAMGTSITLMGTTGSDRVIVTVTMTSGDQYTVIDRYYAFPGSLVPPG